MKLPRIRADFNTSSLDNFWTRADLDRRGFELQEGMRCIFYDFDAEDGQNGLRHCAGTVRWDAKSGVFRIGSPSDDRFTPGNDISVLDDLYPDEDAE